MIVYIKERIVQLKKGEVPNDYKKTEFGVFPRDWVTDNRLGDLFDFYGGFSKSREELGDDGHPYLHYGDLHRNPVNVVSQITYLDMPKYACDISGNETFLMQDGDVAFLDASEDLEGTSRAVLIDNPDNKTFIAGLHIINGRSKNASLQKWYKQYITTSQNVKKQFQRFAVGFKVYGINKDTLPKIQVAYPKSTMEQAKIAEILMKWDEAIAIQEQYIEKIKVKKNALLSSLFSQQTKSWRVATLGSIATMYAGGTPSTVIKEYWGGNIPWIQSGLIQNNVINIEDITARISLKGLNNSSATWIDSDSVLIAITGATCANIAYLTCPATANQSVISITTKQVNAKFLYYYLQFVRNELLSLQNGSAQGGLTLKYLKTFSVRYPNETDQKQITNVLETCDAQIHLHKEKLNMFYLQRKALQQYLLTGIVRVKTN